MLSEQTIQAAKDIDLTMIIGQYTDLKRRGNQMVGLCPFHTERTPSFSVHPTKGYKCFGCEVAGSNVVDFIMKYEGKSFPDAVNHVCGMAGIMIGQSYTPVKRVPPPPPPIDMIPAEAIISNMENYTKNHLFTFMTSLFGDRIAAKLFTDFGVGSCKEFGPGTTLFLQMDQQSNCRQLKAILYDPVTGKRRRDIEPKIIGKVVLRNVTGKWDINLKQCFFNEHEISNRPDCTIGILESEKSAMIASVYYPDLVWLATGGKTGCSWYSSEVSRPLRGKKIILFPDVDGETDWRTQADELKYNTGGSVSIVTIPEIMGERFNPVTMGKYDLADLLLMDHKPGSLAMNDHKYPAIIDYPG